MGKQIHYKKLNEDDILEIVMEHFLNDEFKDLSCTRCGVLGEPGKDLRFIGVFADEKSMEIFNYDLAKIDAEIDFNGDHSFLKKHPEFQIQSSNSEGGK